MFYLNSEKGEVDKIKQRVWANKVTLSSNLWTSGIWQSRATDRNSAISILKLFLVLQLSLKSKNSLFLHQPPSSQQPRRGKPTATRMRKCSPWLARRSVGRRGPEKKKAARQPSTRKKKPERPLGRRFFSLRGPSSGLCGAKRAFRGERRRAGFRRGAKRPDARPAPRGRD
ncbi:hypothetical protein LSM04_006151 [Trypanosoma melophagium]|uniref:uncharacterized protein n=1 Tax=Trypanosoma melophagium TaxID=715481 RepID=UPI003519E39E|nr:hypothetical protein LSM04_006151 [Trypanosoma melophagium]